MKKFLIDQVLFLIVGIGIMICIPLLCGPIFTAVFEVVVAISWGYLCRRILLVPLDLLYGKAMRDGYFVTQFCTYACEFYKGVHYPEWEFLYENKSLVLLVPMAVAIEEIHKIECPPKNVKLRITYFRFSKILLSYEPA